ncbi:2-oxoacid:ferredoxin oxidoreductase subunit alpha [Sulfodiicoccus acidiphilus]|uniref:2-oxoacid oxidoreductase (ferredoxin) n=1 Tax=Sulfodiicoccus acidiphilus TaxID=1670455 RepID=A0A348B467_9CREN|nr:2-oxoacid:ferredoxin oxidoreductase subunit alpha [Sulfodiicoccus acidiphilus]BBD72969.1 2-oxoacid:ferredoxin oxidoreductase subunit alpha [Sulfodiicoccus acidiphilus]GGT87642.1 2-oxoacid:ferredoxin oxidoreductase subunit alpha [Sulfodiicoccus acidiphilus]
MKLTWMIGGAQGSGVDTAANLFGNAVGRAGYYLFGNREYYSNIKGRHSYFTLTISDRRMHSLPEKVDILTTFDAETVFQHFHEVNDYLIYNKGLEGTKIDTIQSIEPELVEEIGKRLESYGNTMGAAVKYVADRGVHVIPVDYDQIAKEVAAELKVALSVVERVRNIAAVAASYGLLGLKEDYLMQAIARSFKNELYAKMNTLGAQRGLKYVKPAYGLKEVPVQGKRVQIDGNTASAMGKLAAGLRFQTYYPITPASDESTYIEAHQEVMMIDPDTGDKRKSAVVVVQTEDELAAVNMAIGAALTGVRASTATSGPGFSLMAEGIGWAGMDEVPIVVTYYIRGAPSTGLPTRSGQADLKFALNVSHGEFPRIVIASGDHVEVFKDAIWAFNLAERYQTPVIHLIEKGLANAYSTVDVSELDYSNIKGDRGKIVDGEENYLRFKLTEDGISPRAFLGHAHMYYTGDEHNEEGHISEASSNRIAMYEKRMKKLETADKEIPEESRVNVFGDSDTVVLTWGSPKGAVLDAMDMLEKDGIKLQLVQIRMFSPFPTRYVSKLLSGKSKIIDLENNYTAQAASVVREHTGIEPTNYVLKWNGRPITRDEVYRSVKLILEKNDKRVVLNAGA